MKKTVLIWIIYLTGCYVGYIDGREMIKSWTPQKSYTQKDRVGVIFLSSFSWLNVIVIEGFKISEKMGKVPAKW